jgi:trehalose/maltose hydrolase-like predicted phosphorylase
VSEKWVLSYDGWDEEQESLREALCTLGNGVFATRGAGEEARADGVRYPGTYIGGGYNRLESVVGGRTIVNEDLVNFPNWLPVKLRPENGEWLDPAAMTLLAYRQELRLREGILVRAYRVCDEAGRETAIVSRRLVHMGAPHTAAIEVAITPVNWSGPLDIHSFLDGSVSNTGVARYRQLNHQHIEVVGMDTVAPDTVVLHVRTTQSRLDVAQAARTQLFRGGESLAVESHPLRTEGVIGHAFTLDAEQGETITIEKVVSLHTSRDRAITQPSEDAALAVDRCGRFDDLVCTQRRAWKELWRAFDVTIDVDAEADLAEHPIQLIVRLHIFHLLQTASPNTIGLDASVPARGLHGEAYRGHIFWDEAYVFPFYNLRLPEITRSLLFYRYHRLDAARAYAEEVGCRGALFPWQSGSNGREETQVVHLNPRSGQWDPDHSRLQRHVNAACAFNVWSYLEATDDRGFLNRYGAEMLLEIARFWASLAQINPGARYEIVGVMGPDEYHERYPNAEEGGLANNAYTNVMAVWCLERALEVLDRLPASRRLELMQQLDLAESELDHWRTISRAMILPIRDDGIIDQFEGYGRLDEFDWEGYQAKYGSIGRLDRILKAEEDSPDHYKLSKQADLCMLFYFLDLKELRPLCERLGYPLDPEMIHRNVDYYLRRTSHGSTLSYVVFTALLDRIDKETGWEYFKTALASDIEDKQGGTTPEGIHAAMMAGTVRIVVENYAGVRIRHDGIYLSPNLPPAVCRIKFPMRYRGSELAIDVTSTQVQVMVDGSAAGPIPIVSGGEQYLVDPGATRSLRL